MEYLRRVCIVSGSSLSVAHTCPTVEPTYWSILVSLENLHTFNLAFISLLSIYFKKVFEHLIIYQIESFYKFEDFHIKYHFLLNILCSNILEFGDHICI